MEKEVKLIKDDVSEKIISIAEELVKRDGVTSMNVRKILKELGTTNRVFYNRFHNIDEVLEEVYSRGVFRMHENTSMEFSPDMDFFDYIMELAVSVLISTYDIKMQYAGYMFEHDSITTANFEKWKERICGLVEYAVSNKLIKPVDPDLLSYSVWCFCRGFNMDAVGRKIPKEDAIKYFRFGFGCFIEGLKHYSDEV